MKKTSMVCSFLLLLIFTGCAPDSKLETEPQNALFCKSISENVQTIEQLHLSSEGAATTEHSTEVSTTEVALPCGMWFTAMDYADILTGKTESEFQATIQEQLQQAKALGVNTVFLQVRAFADAYYPSDYYMLGLSMDADCTYDPLQIMLTEAHALNLSVHAWINPLRCQTTEQMEQMPEQYPIKQWYLDTEKKGTYLVQCGERWWLNPAYPEVRQLIADGVMELVSNYAIDGVQIDDYFYPTTDSTFDAAAFAESGASDLTSWRKEQCNQMVQALYQSAHTANEKIVFGISPQGTESGNEKQCADVKTWCSTAGYCDYILPQLYFGFENTSAPFADMVTFWAEQTTCPEVSLWIGICTYKLGTEDTWAGDGITEWQTDLQIPSEEIALLLTLKNIDGIAIYDYAATFLPEDSSIQTAMAAERERIQNLLQP